MVNPASSTLVDAGVRLERAFFLDLVHHFLERFHALGCGLLSALFVLLMLFVVAAPGDDEEGNGQQHRLLPVVIGAKSRRDNQQNPWK